MDCFRCRAGLSQARLDRPFPVFRERPMVEPALPHLLRRAGWIAGLWALALTIVGMVLAPDLARARPQVVDVRLEQQNRVSRVELVVDAPVSFRAFTLGSPLRLVVDLPAVDWRTAASQLERVALQTKQVAAVRYGRLQSSTLRIVFDLTEPITVQDVSLRPHGNRHAVVLRWQSTKQYRPQRFGDFQVVPIPPPRPVKSKPQRLPLIVIDAGHGGVDPGTRGKRNTVEKDVTLAVALQLAKVLQATGHYRVALTREDDRFLQLRERTRIAKRLDADLFVSLHADSASDPRAKGLSVYTLSERATDGEAASLAQQENKADLIGGMDLTDERPDVVSILIDLAQRETRNRSMRFANQLVQALVLRVPLLDHPYRQAGFAVLKAPDVPAVLIELGFLSHPDEEQLLRSSSHRAAIIEGIVAAMDNFFADRQRGVAAAGG
jgi:N-acetylmuramoyl-L-alanine amidase